MDHRRRERTTLPSSNRSDVYSTVARAHLENLHGPFISIRTHAGLVSVRDALPSDVDAYITYWHYSGERIKNLLGIDLRKLGSPEDTRERFFSMIRASVGFQKNVIFTITLNDRIIGYTNINQHGPDDNYAHLHTYRFLMKTALEKGDHGRRPKSGHGLAAVLIGPIIAMYFSLYPIRRVILQTRPENHAINNALDLYLLPAERKYVENPAGLAAAGDQFLRYVYKDQLPHLLNRAELLRKSMGATALRGEQLHDRMLDTQSGLRWMPRGDRPVQ